MPGRSYTATLLDEEGPQSRYVADAAITETNAGTADMGSRPRRARWADRDGELLHRSWHRRRTSGLRRNRVEPVAFAAGAQTKDG